jgi:hypothetical protein
LFDDTAKIITLSQESVVAMTPLSHWPKSFNATAGSRLSDVFGELNSDYLGEFVVGCTNIFGFTSIRVRGAMLDIKNNRVRKSREFIL